MRLRPTARQRPRWAPVGALAAAAVLVVAVAIIVPGLLAPSVASTPLPSAAPVRTRDRQPIGEPRRISVGLGDRHGDSAPSAPPPSPSATGVKGVPPIPSEPLAGAPGSPTGR